jgi:hypothetical protein
MFMNLQTNEVGVPRQVSKYSPIQRIPQRRLPRVAAQQLRVGELKPREDGRGAKRRARLPLAVLAVADVEGEGLRGGRLEAHGAALTGRFHDDGWCCCWWWWWCNLRMGD